ncbi:MAG TPA: (d)CMP kinase [Dehalococcoidia bacterium]|nr:(d)CMP kinase [Dehalococcoidia bacterium]
MSIPSLIAIDEPGAVGKSIVGKMIAQKLGYRFIDTGEMYRALAWLALHLGINLEDKATLGKLAREARIEVVSSAEGGYNYVLVNDFNVTDEIHSPRVEAEVSQVAKMAGVREALVAQQRSMAGGGKTVMAGRDIGTGVLSQAELKVFLIASAEERARRRYQEQGKKGKLSYKNILAELKRRDEIDTKRALSPLSPALDAKVINTEGLSAEQVTTSILTLIEKSKIQDRN